jgi:hypothetical protein
VRQADIKSFLDTCDYSGDKHGLLLVGAALVEEFLLEEFPYLFLKDNRGEHLRLDDGKLAFDIEGQGFLGEEVKELYAHHLAAREQVYCFSPIAPLY